MNVRQAIHTLQAMIDNGELTGEEEIGEIVEESTNVSFVYF